MKHKLLSLLFIPFLLAGCWNKTVDINDRKSGEIGAFSLLSPNDGYETSEQFTFTWEAAENAEYYQLEIANTETFINDEDEVYVKESNIIETSFYLNYPLPRKDITYYWRVTAVNSDTKKVSSKRSFFYSIGDVGELPIEIEDAQDWAVHKEGSQANVTIDRNNFFGNNKNSLVISFDKEHTSQGIASSDGWIVITKTEDRELYGTDAFYFNFYYSGHDATVLIRVLDYDGEYWHQRVKISNNSKQTILMKYEDFELRTAGTNIFNRVFDWQHIRYFEIVFERTFGDGICALSDIKAVQFDNYKCMFMDKMNFKWTDMKNWTYENHDFRDDLVISEDGSEITLNYGSGVGYGFQNVDLYRYFITGDALRMKVKYTGTSSSANFYFRVLEEDTDRWQFKCSFSYFVKDDYKELIIPLKAFQRTDYMAGDGAKQFYFIKKFNFGFADSYSPGSLSIKDLEVVKLDDLFPNRKKTVSADGMIENYNNYTLYTEIYYQWLQSFENKDEAMKLDSVHKAPGIGNRYCAEYDYKADMEQAQYQLYMNSAAAVGFNAFSIKLKDASVKPSNAPAAVGYIDPADVKAKMTIQLTMDSGEWYRYEIDAVEKDWSTYTISFDDFTCFNEKSLIDDKQPLSSEHIIHMGFAFEYIYRDQFGNKCPTYAIANPVYIDDICFTNADASSIEEVGGYIVPDTDNENVITIDTLENYSTTDDILGYWDYGNHLEYSEMELVDEVSSEGGAKSIRMHYKGATSVSYARYTQFGKGVVARGMTIDIKGDGVANVHVNLNWRHAGKLYKMRYTILAANEGWYRYQIGFSSDNFKDVDGSSASISQSDVIDIESISFGITRSTDVESDIYVDNIRFLTKELITYKTCTRAAIA